MPEKKDIPTLTNIVHEGDDSMLNHFDAHQLDEDAEGSADTPHLTENATSFENIDFENMDINSGELENISSINPDENAADKIFSGDDDSTDFPINSFVDLESPDIEIEPDNTSDENTDDKSRQISRPQKEAIQRKIDEAISDAIPWIELNLKKQLYKKFDI